MDIKVQTPPTLTGSSEQQLKQVYSYLYQLSQSLNMAGGEITSIMQKQVVDAVDNSDVLAEAGHQYVALKDLIINTAEIVRSEMDVISTTLTNRYEAFSSQFGAYQEQVQQTITATGASIKQEIISESGINTISDQIADFQSYMTRTEGYIQSGVIDTDEYGNAEIGIAIGRNLQVRVIDGVQYIDRNQSCAFYLPDRVSFRMNGREVAYFSSTGMHVGDIEQSGKTTIAGNWEVKNTSQNHLSITWIGG